MVECPAGAKARARALVSNGTHLRAGGLPAPLAVLGISTIPPDVVVWSSNWNPAADTPLWPTDNPPELVWIDGSALHPRDPLLRTAGWGATWIDLDGNWRHGGGFVPGRQTAGRAELTGLVWVLSIAGPTTQIYSDCQNVVEWAVRLGHARALPLPPDLVKGPMADLWAQLRNMLQHTSPFRTPSLEAAAPSVGKAMPARAHRRREQLRCTPLKLLSSRAGTPQTGVLCAPCPSLRAPHTHTRSVSARHKSLALTSNSGGADYQAGACALRRIVLPSVRSLDRRAVFSLRPSSALGSSPQASCSRWLPAPRCSAPGSTRCVSPLGFGPGFCRTLTAAQLGPSVAAGAAK